MRPRATAACLLSMLVFLSASTPIYAAEPAAPLKAGIIGLDAHARDWTKILNDPNAPGELGEMTVVAGFPGGSPDIPQSLDLLEKGKQAFREMEVPIVDSIEALLEKVDVVMILSIDGRTHLEQARPVIAAGKTVYIDKPIAGSLADAMGMESAVVGRERNANLDMRSVSSCGKDVSPDGP